jgi:hypothetical protein
MFQVLAMSEQKTQGYWLPESVVLRLTMFEAGWLTGHLSQIPEQEAKCLTVNKPGPDGEPVPNHA